MTSRLTWEIGTAYDLFVSLDVLHHPMDYDVRSVWAAGVRARIPLEHRKILEASLLLLIIPFSWIYSLPQPKNGRAVIDALRELDPADRLPTLALEPSWPEDHREILTRIAKRKRWSEIELGKLTGIYRQFFHIQDKKAPTAQAMIQMLDWWTRAEEFGERYLQAVEVYYDSFFAQEERRLQPALQNSLIKAQNRSKLLPLKDLLEELSQGLRFEELPEDADVVLAPSFWSTPLVYFGDLGNQKQIYLFGARPATDPLVPGEAIPDALLRVLKALSDSTRLQMLKYLSEQPQTPTNLAQRLRLRLPTIVHHLNVLRLAGLVTLTLGEEAVTKHYTARYEAVVMAQALLDQFLHTPDSDE